MTKPTRYPDSQFDKEHSTLMATAARFVQMVFFSISATSADKPNDILRALRIALRKFASGQEN
jgi:hypothetical protein